jgi:hypothetical protein
MQQTPTTVRSADDSTINTSKNRNHNIVRPASPDSPDEADESPMSPKDGEPLSNDEAIRMIRELLDGARKYRNETEPKSAEAEISPMNNKPKVNNGAAPGTTPSSFMDEEESSPREPVDVTLLQSFSMMDVDEKQNPNVHDYKEQQQEKKNKRMDEEDENAADAKELEDLLLSEEKTPPLSSKDEKSLILFPAENKFIADLKNKSQEDDKSPIIFHPHEKAEPKHKEGYHLLEENGEKRNNNLNLNNMSIDIDTQTSPSTSAASTVPAMPPAPASILSASGNLICNLKDHRVLAGCTAVVALLAGKTLFVANAGDSRAVMMRNGEGVALSEDHKPNQDRELNRITTAGGYVNAVGRVNGNLNLSRYGSCLVFLFLCI